MCDLTACLDGTELLLIMAMLAQSFTVEIPESEPTAEFSPLLTLQCRDGIRLRIKPR